MSLTEHLSSGNTTICYCWVVRRQDGEVLGFTDHDVDVVADGVTCLSTTGITTSTFAQSLGLSIDDLEIEGVIDDDSITEVDIRGGLYDGASVDLYIVNWDDTDEFLHLASGEFGELVETDGGGFQTEFLSRVVTLNQPSGRVYQRTCDTVLGSEACTVDLTDPSYRTDTTVVVVVDDRMTVASLSGFDDDWFTLGKIITEDGQEIGIRRHVGTTLDLWRSPDVTIEPTTPVTVIAGCKQDVNTCREKFDNVLNFQGFNLIPGNDRLTAYPVRGQDDYDGGSLFK